MIGAAMQRLGRLFAVGGRLRIMVLAYLFLQCCFINPGWAQPLAANGILDLGAVDLRESGSVRLDGQWAFYPDQLLSPAAFGGSGRLVEDLLVLPGSWNGFVKDGRRLDGRGVATLRLQVVPPRQEGDLALRIFDVHSAYRLWVDGKLVSARGTIGEGAATERADPSLDMPVVHNDGKPLDLVLEVSNHHYREGGVTASLELGTEAAIRNGQGQRWALALFFVGSLLTMGCYHLFHYFFRRSNPAPLYFGLYCLLWMGNFVASNSSDWVVQLFIPQARADILERINLVCFFLSVPVGYLFFRALFPREFSSRVMNFSGVFFAAAILLAVAAPMITVQLLVPYSYLASLLLIGYCLLRLARARRRQREGAGIILIGFAILGVIAANDMLNDLQLIHSIYLIPLGMFCFILSQGFAFSLSLSRAFSAVECLSTDLEERNLALQLEAVERARLEKEVVNISENERRRLSLDLHDGLCQELTAARLRCSVLQHKLGDRWPGDGELAQLSRLLDDSVNHAYELSRGLWPLDHEQPGMTSFLEDFCRRLAASKGIVITVRNLRTCGNLADDNAIHLYRIAQEAINNAVRHARASRIDVALECASHPDRLMLSVRDNGVGVGRASASTSPGGLGMRIMAHRARMIGGALKIEGAGDGGTEVVCRILCEHCVQNGLAK